MKPVAFITPWFDKGLTGGAEQTAWQIATRISKRGYKVEVLTTSCRSFLDDWSKNHFRPGVFEEDGLVIRRFSVNKRNRIAFDQVNQQLLNIPSNELETGVGSLSSESTKIFVKDNINSDSLIQFLKYRHRDYAAFIFIPYLYGPIINGLPIVSDRALLVPCLHDEAYAYLDDIKCLFYRAKWILFNSEGERTLAERLYGPAIIPKSEVTGLGIEFEENTIVVDDYPGAAKLLGKRYILYLGRRDPTKNVGMLVERFATYKQKFPESDLRLVLAGPGNQTFQDSENEITDLGFVSTEEKNALLSNCLSLIQPSRNESYSRVIMEAWHYGKPVVAHQRCLATASIVEKSGGGWTANVSEDWVDIFSTLDDRSEVELTKRGLKGRSYALDYSDWDKVIDRYERVVNSIKRSDVARVSMGDNAEVHQILPTLSYGDAISNHAVTIRNHLRSVGYRSDIYARYLDDRIAKESKVFGRDSIPRKACLLYHHSIGSEVTEYVVNHYGPKCLIYHNITPDRFYENYNLKFASILKRGREELTRLSTFFEVSVGDSRFNASELDAAGFQSPGVLPLIIDSEKWVHTGETELRKYLQNGIRNILFIGRIAPNKCQHDLVDAFFEYRKMDCGSRLLLVGHFELDDAYYNFLEEKICQYDLENQVILTGSVSEQKLQAFYDSAHLFWSMSEHEGFCVPLVEAMWFDVPVLAFNSSAVPETLGRAGMMFNTKKDLPSVAALAKIITHDAMLRQKILTSQRQRRIDFLPDQIIPLLEDLVSRMVNLSA